jgi:hypothetical protein
VNPVAAARDWLTQYADSIRIAYGVDPRVFIALVLVSIPPFYIAFAVAVRSLVRLRQQRAPAASDKAFIAASSVVVATWLLPYAYVALFGRLPWWAWWLLAVLLVAGALRLLRTGRKRASAVSVGAEVRDD